jgi:hypothetical protein
LSTNATCRADELLTRAEGADVLADDADGRDRVERADAVAHEKQNSMTHLNQASRDIPPPAV